MLEVAISGSITVLCVIMSMWYMGRKAEKLAYRLIGETTNDIMGLINSEDGAKLFYSVGAMIGNGAKAGFGLQKSGGKMKFVDMLKGIAAQWIASKAPQFLNLPTGQPQLPQESNTPQW